MKDNGFRMLIEGLILKAVDSGVDANVSVALDVGPDEASALLGMSKGNRSERKDVIDKYARDIAAGRWLMHNGNPIMFDVDGVLIDGHHRLRAVLRAGVPAKFRLSFGNPSEAKLRLDGGVTRNMRDQFSMSGETVQATTIASLNVYRMLCECERSGKSLYSLSSKRATFDEMRELIRDTNDDFCAIAMNRSKWPPAMWGTLLFCYPISNEVVRKLAADIHVGEGIVGPAFALREYILKTRTRVHGSAGVFGGSAQINMVLYTVYAFKAALEGRSLAKFSPKSDPSTVFAWLFAKRAKA